MAALGLIALIALDVGVSTLAAVMVHATKDSPAAAAETAHMAAIRADIVRIHKGRVDPETLRKISEHIEAIHRAVLAQASFSSVPGGAAPSGTPALMDAVARFQAPGSLNDDWSTSDLKPHGSAELAQASPAAPPPVAAPVPDDRTFVGQKTCEGCHQQEASNWAHTIHAKVFDFHPRNGLEAEGCEACHGPGSDHVKNPSDMSTIISFSSKSVTPVAVQNAQCFSCHKGGQRIFWHDSIHETNNLGCSDCHNPMANFAAHGLTARQSINETCFQCHKVQRMEFGERSHMPLLEGKISCADCHNPHGSATPPLLKADSVNELCYSCHADKRGPFLFEHAPVRENCLNCHKPHGSNFEDLLTVARPLLCQQCHTQDGHPAQLLTSGNLAMGPMPDPRLLSTSCQTCHVNIHGSNDPAGERFER